MAVPDYQTLMLPVLEDVVSRSTDTTSLIKRISDFYKLSEDERTQLLPSKKDTTISNRVRWATTYLCKAGLMERPERGILKATELGIKIVQSKPGRIDNDFLSQFEGFRKFRNKNDNEYGSNIAAGVENEKTPEDLISDAYAKLEQAARDEILENIIKSSPLFFERLILDLFKGMGYGSRGDSSHVGKSGDGGIDGIINEDPLGLEKVYLQAKRYTDAKIGVEQIRSFAGSLDEKGARKGIFVTTSTFAMPAYEYAERSPKSLVLIDGEELTRLMYEYDVGVRTVQTIKIKKPDIDYFEDL